MPESTLPSVRIFVSIDALKGEQRGSAAIERYIDPNNTQIPDYAAGLASNASATPTDLGQFYQWRVLSKRIFAP